MYCVSDANCIVLVCANLNGRSRFLELSCCLSFCAVPLLHFMQS